VPEDLQANEQFLEIPQKLKDRAAKRAPPGCGDDLEATRREFDAIAMRRRPIAAGQTSAGRAIRDGAPVVALNRNIGRQTVRIVLLLACGVHQCSGRAVRS
jgi:hypothetical protein